MPGHMEYDYMQKDLAFRNNLGLCKNIIFGLRYSDITAMTGVLQPTMSSYDAQGVPVSPFLRTGKMIADMYCTSIQRLCSYQIYFDSGEVLDMMVHFIQRLGGVVNMEDVQENLFSSVQKWGLLTKYTVQTFLRETFTDMIKDFCKSGVFYHIEPDEEICKTFTENYNHLMLECQVTYRKVSEICRIGLGTLARLKRGAEPTISVVLRLSDFFGISISQLITPNPEYDLVKIAGESIFKKRLKDREDVPSDKEYEIQEEERYNLITKDEAKDYIAKYLDQIKAGSGE